jgi:DNA-binding transcriptional MerR regulator
MEYTWETLHKMPVKKLREIAEELGDHEELHGFLTMHKENLVPALCHAFGIEDHAHHEVVGVDKAAIKAEIRELKKQRDEALDAKDSVQLKRVRRKIHRLKRKLHKATV